MDLQAPPPPSKRPPPPAAVAAHYNSSFHFASAGKRKTLTSYRLRGLNNSVKHWLIAQYTTTKQPHALDVAGGKGGDLSKWAEAGVEYWCCVDISRVSLVEAKSRWSKAKGRTSGTLVPHATFVVVDCGTEYLWQRELAPLTRSFHIASCQFALHYCFDTEARARTVLQSVADALLPGAHFVGTMVDAARVVARLRASVAQGGRAVLGNSLYSVDAESYCKGIGNKDASCPIFGAAYSFTLQDAVHDCVEYLIHWPTFVKLAAEVGLTPVTQVPVNFHTFIAEGLLRGDAELVESLRAREAVDPTTGTLDAEQWEVAGLYCYFVFKKEGEEAAPGSAESAPVVPVQLSGSTLDWFAA